MKDLAKKYLSFSQIDCYLNCPKKYEFIYIQKSKRGTSPELLIGTRVHSAIAKMLEKKRDGKGKPSSMERRKIIISSAGKLKKDLSNLRIKRIYALELMKQHDMLLDTWVTNILPIFIPTAVEEKIETKIGGYPFLMYIDAVHDYKIVYDWKVTGRAKSQIDATNSLQLSIYAIGTGIHEVAFGSLVRPKKGARTWNPKVVTVHSLRGKKELMWAEKVVSNVAEGILRRYFPMCSPDHYLCSKNYCEFYDRCRGADEVKEPDWLKQIDGKW
jgi:hypothetical protein